MHYIVFSVIDVSVDPSISTEEYFAVLSEVNNSFLIDSPIMHVNSCSVIYYVLPVATPCRFSTSTRAGYLEKGNSSLASTYAKSKSFETWVISSLLAPAMALPIGVVGKICFGLM